MEHASAGGGEAATITSGSYLAGFGLAILLTLTSFGLVMSGALPPSDTVYAIFAAAIAQVLVHLHYFLHLDGSVAQRWNLTAILFTTLIIGIVVGGSIWIMYSLNYRTMDPFSVCTPGHWIPGSVW
jgi:cytochrome o ubiquinol oxidase subunit IV